jgi:hypothetical protein
VKGYSKQQSRCISDVTKEVNRVMANPEINGNPVALDFSKKESATGYSRRYVGGFDRIFGKGRKKGADSLSSNPSSLDSSSSPDKV